MSTLSLARRFAAGLAFSVALGAAAASLNTPPLLLETAVEQADVTALQPEAVHSRTAVEILARLDRHYANRKLDDRLSSEMLDRYLRDLDPSRLYFIQSDITEFEQFRLRLDDQLRAGNLSAGYQIYNRYLQRVEESIGDLLSTLSNGIDDLDFEGNDTVMIDRREAPWAKSSQEKRELWQRRLKDAVLTMRLNGDAEDEIAGRLERRYSSQLKRLRQSTPEDVFQIYINALTTTFDPHTNYHTPHNSENFTINMSRSLEGIGAVLQAEDEFTKVVRLIPGGPAAKSGLLRPADRIVGVAQDEEELVNVIGWRLDEVVNLIRGPKGSQVRLEVIPAGSPSEHNTRMVPITRNKVVLEDQAAKSDVLTIPRGERELRIGVITIPTFYLDFEAMHRGDPDYTSTTRDVAELLISLQEQDVDGLVIDLRDNGGGALQEATQLVSLFIDRGPTVQVRDARGRVIVEPDQFSGQLFDGPLAVLVNRHSASASEIFAGAMQDYGRALIIGDETFGKGTVQTLIPLNHGQLKMTQAKFYRVSGGSNQHRGVVPDISLPFLIDKTEIGESAQSNALPWDQINAASFKATADLTPYIEPLKRKRDQRIKQDPEFHYIGERLSLLTLLRERTEISLNEAQRKQDQSDIDKARLATENRLRAARGLKALDSIKALKEQEEALIAARMAGEDSQEKDPYLEESGRVLADLIHMISRKQLVVLDPAA